MADVFQHLVSLDDESFGVPYDAPMFLSQFRQGHPVKPFVLTHCLLLNWNLCSSLYPRAISPRKTLSSVPDSKGSDQPHRGFNSNVDSFVSLDQLHENFERASRLREVVVEVRLQYFVDLIVVVL